MEFKLSESKDKIFEPGNLLESIKKDLSYEKIAKVYIESNKLTFDSKFKVLLLNWQFQFTDILYEIGAGVINVTMLKNRIVINYTIDYSLGILSETMMLVPILMILILGADQFPQNLLLLLVGFIYYFIVIMISIHRFHKYLKGLVEDFTRKI